MATHRIPIWSCIHIPTSSNAPPDVVRLLSQVKFNGKNNSSAFNHALQFIQKVSGSDIQRIDECVLCRSFTLTFTAEARKWCRTLPVALIHSWDQFVKIFIFKFDCYDYDQVYDEIDYLWDQDEPLRDFNMRFHLKCLKYDLESELTDEESLDYDEYSLPPMSDQAEISSNFVSFSSNMNEDSKVNTQTIHNEENLKSLRVMHALIPEDKNENAERETTLEPEDDSDAESDNIITNQRMQMPRLEHRTISLSKSISAQRYDLKPDVYDESDEKSFFYDVFKCIIPDSHFSLYPDVFSDDNFSPLNIKDTSKNTEGYSNDSSLGFQDKETALAHPLTNVKQELLDLPCLKIYNEKEEPWEICRVFCDSYFDNDDVVELFQETQLGLDNEKHLKSEIISVNPHFKVKDHLNDSTIQDNTLIYDSYHEESSIPVCNHNLFPDSQDLASSCEEKDVTSKSQLCCDTICTNSHSFLSHLHSFCTKSDFFLNFQTFDRLAFSDLYMGTFISNEIAKSLALTKNRLQAIITKKSLSELLSFLLREHQVITEIHPNFYDPIGTQLERSSHEKGKSDRIPIEVICSYSTANIYDPRKIRFFTLMFGSFIQLGIKMNRWFHWKYHFT